MKNTILLKSTILFRRLLKLSVDFLALDDKGLEEFVSKMGLAWTLTTLNSVRTTLKARTESLPSQKSE